MNSNTSSPLKTIEKHSISNENIINQSSPISKPSKSNHVGKKYTSSTPSQTLLAREQKQQQHQSQSQNQNQQEIQHKYLDTNQRNRFYPVNPNNDNQSPKTPDHNNLNFFITNSAQDLAKSHSQKHNISYNSNHSNFSPVSGEGLILKSDVQQFHSNLKLQSNSNSDKKSSNKLPQIYQFDRYGKLSPANKVLDFGKNNSNDDNNIDDEMSDGKENIRPRACSVENLLNFSDHNKTLEQPSRNSSIVLGDSPQRSEDRVFESISENNSPRYKLNDRRCQNQRSVD